MGAVSRVIENGFRSEFGRIGGDSLVKGARGHHFPDLPSDPTPFVPLGEAP
jgi:hypothetical protein